MIWLEALFRRLPVAYDSLRTQLLVRYTFLAAIWVSGYLVYSLESLSSLFLSSIGLHLGLFATGMITLFGTYMVQKALPPAVTDVKPLLDLSGEEFEELHRRTTGYVCDFRPVLALAGALIAFNPGVREALTSLQMEGFAPRYAWNILAEFFFHLINGTGLWLGFSIWLAVLTISRQPFNHGVREVNERFSGLAVLVLWFSAFYFISLSIGVATSLMGSPSVSLFDLLFSPLLVFLALGFLWVFFPFFSIHQALSGIKKAELMEIEKDYRELIQRSNEDASPEESIIHVQQLLSLQLRERMTMNMDEWPINIGFVTKLLTLILIPALVRVSAEFINKYIH